MNMKTGTEIEITISDDDETILVHSGISTHEVTVRRVSEHAVEIRRRRLTPAMRAAREVEKQKDGQEHG